MKRTKNSKFDQFYKILLITFYMLCIFLLSFTCTFCSTASKPRYTPHILERRFALTPTAYKYLDIGIVVESMSDVEIAIGDNRGNRIILPHTTWKAFIDRRANIQRLMQSNVIIITTDSRSECRTC